MSPNESIVATVLLMTVAALLYPLAAGVRSFLVALANEIREDGAAWRAREAERDAARVDRLTCRRAGR